MMYPCKHAIPCIKWARTGPMLAASARFFPFKAGYGMFTDTIPRSIFTDVWIDAVPLFHIDMCLYYPWFHGNQLVLYYEDKHHSITFDHKRTQ